MPEDDDLYEDSTALKWMFSIGLSVIYELSKRLGDHEAVTTEGFAKDLAARGEAILHVMEDENRDLWLDLMDIPVDEEEAGSVIARSRSHAYRLVGSVIQRGVYRVRMLDPPDGSGTEPT